MASHDVLSAEAELALGRRIRKGDQSAVKALVEANLGFAAYMAGQFRRYSVDYDDLVQEAHVGLILAARHFDPNRGARFATYAAWWIEARLRRFLAHRSYMIKVSEETRRVARRLLRAEEKLLQTGQSSTVKALAQSEHIGLRTAEFALAAANARTLSLDHPSQFGSEDLTLSDRVADDSSAEGFDRAEAAAVVEISIDTLPVKQRQVLELLYYDNHSYAEIAQELSLSVSRVRQLESKALTSLRRSVLLSAARINRTSTSSVSTRKGCYRTDPIADGSLKSECYRDPVYRNS